MKKIYLGICLTLFFNFSRAQIIKENFYDFVKNYYLNKSTEDTAAEGGFSKIIDRTYKIWGPRLHPTGDFRVLLRR